MIHFLVAILAICMLLVTLMAFREVWNFRRSHGAVRLRRLTLRLSIAAMLDFLLLSIIVGVGVFGLNEPDGLPTLWLAFWGCIALLTGGVFCMAIADLRTFGDETLHESNLYWEEMTKIVTDHRMNHPKE